MNRSELSRLVNKKSYSSPKVAKYWSTYSDDLLYGEQQIIADLAPIITGSRFLDLGVGGGRTTKHLLPLVSSYLGADYSELLIEACKQKYPEASFKVVDVCDINLLRANHFDFAFFSFNGIDCLTAAQRHQFLLGLAEVLTPGGHFLFSSHNFYRAELNTSLQATLHREILALSSAHAYTPRQIYHFASSLWRYHFRSYLQSIGDDCAFLLDRAQGYRELYAWIKPEKQIQDLEKAGFVVQKLYSWHGNPFQLGDPGLRDSPSVYYLCKTS